MRKRTRSDSSYPLWLARAAILLCLAFSSVGCECGVPIGSASGDGGVDARIGPRTDECGNGLDDDGNGLIDDGCPCGPGETQRCFSGALSSNETGACRSGTQACAVAPGGEWSDWGLSACEGEALPSEEACDGTDADCDGAVDEGCPCTDGMTFDCGAEFVTAPCMAGTQTCRAGAWSGCEGAVRPSPDVCADGIDNDCDGEVDDGCDCVPSPEVCRDGIDNDCDGEIDEPACTPDWGLDAGMPVPDAGLPPPEDCTTPVVPDFRDRIVWHTAIPGVGGAMTNVGGHDTARLAGSGGSLVAIALDRSGGTGSYTFGGTVTAEDRLGYLSFADGTPGASHAWPGPFIQIFDTSGERLGVMGTFLGTVDIGLGSWTSDPTLYTTMSGPRPIADLIVASAAVGSGAVTGGRNFSITGVPADPAPGSFWPLLTPFATGVDPAGNVYVTGRFQGAISLDGTRVESSATPFSWTDWGAFIASFTETGALRWLEARQYATGAELAVDPDGRYVALMTHPLLPSGMGGLELRDAATGAVLFNHSTLAGAGLSILAIDVDSSGTVVAIGLNQRTTAASLGTLSVPPGQNYVASFDRTGALLWSHELTPEVWPDHQTVRYNISTNGTEVAMVLGTRAVTSLDPRHITIGSCGRDIPRRAYPRSPETGRAVLWPMRGSSWWEAEELLVAVLDARTGEHRWSRLIDSIGSSASLALHPGGDVVVAVHRERGDALVDYGDGPQMDATHVFRLRGR